jgi:hypothetical protein
LRVGDDIIAEDERVSHARKIPGISIVEDLAKFKPNYKADTRSPHTVRMDPNSPDHIGLLEHRSPILLPLRSKMTTTPQPVFPRKSTVAAAGSLQTSCGVLPIFPLPEMNATHTGLPRLYDPVRIETIFAPR